MGTAAGGRRWVAAAAALLTRDVIRWLHARPARRAERGKSLTFARPIAHCASRFKRAIVATLNAHQSR
ncbi:hypothetical protein LAUMK35_05807 [Mycobacterium pseudokansasii]|nr:hypothetical protein LAUMK35_05807 [Mycobacterium pseudokansasii]VBA36134.1 hypothetical protein LAUMK21_05786 [Mycobacterium pseudokansasii]